MATTTIRISQQTRSTLRQLADESGLSIRTVIDHAIKVYRRAQFFAALDAAHDRLWNDPVARVEELAERALLEGTLADDLDEGQHTAWPVSSTGNIEPPALAPAND